MLGANRPSVQPSSPEGVVGPRTPGLTRRRAGAAALATALAGTALLAVSPDAGAADPGATITLKPRGVLTGDQVTATGTVSTTQARPLRLQRLKGDETWETVATATTATDGAYTVTDPQSRTGDYRVMLSPMTVKGVSYERITSPTRTAVPAAILENGRTLQSGQFLTSTNGTYKLWMRTNGNLTLTTVADQKTVLWQTGTGGRPGARLVMQYRGNAVLVDADNVMRWSTGSSDATAELALYANGNVVVRNGDGKVLWDRTNGLAGGTSTSAYSVRGMSWVDARVPYSQSRYYSNKFGSYRTDCSGFISLMWALNSSYTTRTIPNITTTISKAALKPGDVLNAYNYHVVLFDGWANAEKTKYYAFEQSPSSGATRHVIPYPYWSSSRPGSFVPRRLDTSKARSMARFATTMDDGGDAGPVGR